jgi:ABC-2 type transport system ATP-binding protein
MLSSAPILSPKEGTQAARAIEVEGLVKHYKVHRRQPGTWAAVKSIFSRKYETVRAVEELSFRIAAGERVGFLGPNGAGKTTTLKVLAGLLHPTAGTVRVAGHVPQRRDPGFLTQITLVMGQKQQLIWDLPPAETFALNRAIYDVPRDRYEQTMRELQELLDLEKLVSKPTRQLSLGERMKCELAAALLHRPGILFLDEPTIGLDVSMQAAMREFIRAYNEKHGATVLLTSHYMVDVASLCPRVIVIDRGKLLYDGDLKKLIKQVNPDKFVKVALSASVDGADLARYGEVVTREDRAVTLRVGQETLRDACSALLSALPIVDLTVEDPPLEDIMRQLFAETRETREAKESKESEETRGVE